MIGGFENYAYTYDAHLRAMGDREMNQSEFKRWITGLLLTCPMIVCQRLGKAGVKVIEKTYMDDGLWTITVQCKECKRKWKYMLTVEDAE